MLARATSPLIKYRRRHAFDIASPLTFQDIRCGEISLDANRYAATLRGYAAAASPAVSFRHLRHFLNAELLYCACRYASFRHRDMTPFCAITKYHAERTRERFSAIKARSAPRRPHYAYLLPPRTMQYLFQLFDFIIYYCLL